MSLRMAFVDELESQQHKAWVTRTEVLKTQQRKLRGKGHYKNGVHLQIRTEFRSKGRESAAFATKNSEVQCCRVLGESL